MAKYKITGIIILYIALCIGIYKTNDYKTISIPEDKIITENLTLEEININNDEIIKNEPIENTSIGSLIISKINLNKPLYSTNDKKNNIEDNVTILNGSISPEKENSIIFLAAHSGPAPNSFFNDLDKLEKNDQVILNINNIEYNYIVTSIWETSKDGSIEVSKQKENQLILTTCSKKDKNKQLIVNTIKKET